MRLLLDTNIISELRKRESPRADPWFSRWAAGIATQDQYLSAVTVYEIATGVRRLERRDPRQGRILRSWFEEEVLPGFSWRIVPVDTEIALEASHIAVEAQLPLADALIAATGLVSRMPVVTRNISHFGRVPHLSIINPWDPVF